MKDLRSRGERIDYLTFVPDGEPTLDAGLSQEIDLLRPLGVPIAVISNASLAWRPEVARALNKADWVSVKVDTVDKRAWRRMNRPHRDMQLPAEQMMWPLLEKLAMRRTDRPTRTPSRVSERW